MRYFVSMSHSRQQSGPSPILYWGTPVVLISTENEDGTSNVSPMSSAWWLGHSCVLGLISSSKTTENILRTKQCVLNLPDDSMATHVSALTSTTGSNPVPPSKPGFEFVKDKWARARLTPEASDFVRPPRIAECPVQMECGLIEATNLWTDMPDREGMAMAIEVRVLRVHVLDRLRVEGHPNRVDPDKWRPLIMSFRQLYGLSPENKDTENLLTRHDEERFRILTRSGVKKLPGDGDADIAAKGFV
ncbi:hypothetical protein GQ53DRAFT_793191 [Thozetella sp. PMI_491]|nr:hypothetical protein GQ53DRAFT_793191 [Thozetella sp. PMI_491]